MQAEITATTFVPGDYVDINQHNNWDDDLGDGIVRFVSEDGRVVHVEEPGDLGLMRFSPDEIRHKGSGVVASTHGGCIR